MRALGLDIGKRRIGVADSGTTGQACIEAGRRFVLVDDSEQAMQVMARRFAGVEGIRWVGFDRG